MISCAMVFAKLIWDPVRRRIQIDYHPPREQWLHLVPQDMVEARMRVVLESFSFRPLLVDIHGDAAKGAPPPGGITMGDIELELNRVLADMVREGWIGVKQ